MGKAELEGDAERVASERGSDEDKKERIRNASLLNRTDRRDAEQMGPHSKNGLAGLPPPTPTPKQPPTA